MRLRHATKQARRRWNNRNYYERHRDAIRARRRARYWKQREAILGCARKESLA